MDWLDSVWRRVLLALPVPMRERLHFAWRYRTDSTPWDTGQTPPEVVAWANGRPAGRMLDLGCGTGTNVLYFAERGWEATGVDFVGHAIEQAQRKRASRGLSATFLQGDVTHLEQLPLTAPYDLVLDIGCLHAVPDEPGRKRYAEQVARLTAPGATYLLYAALRGAQTRPRGVDPEEVAALFGPHFVVREQEMGTNPGRTWRSVWYWLERL